MNNKNPGAEIAAAVEKIAVMAGMNERQKLEYRANIYGGLVLNLLADGASLVPKEKLGRLKALGERKEKDAAVIEAALIEFFQEMAETEAGKKLFCVRTRELIRKMILPAMERLNEAQRAEISRILQ